MTKDNICREKYERITKLLITRGLSITVMESCTGGVIAALLTDTEGASEVFKGSFVTYSNEAKVAAGVPEEIINTCGVYSEETAKEMAEACRRSFDADLGIGVTGTFANPDPANEDSVPGEVFFAICTENETWLCCLNDVTSDPRYMARMKVAEKIADKLLEMILQ